MYPTSSQALKIVFALCNDSLLLSILGYNMVPVVWPQPAGKSKCRRCQQMYLQCGIVVYVLHWKSSDKELFIV